MFFPFEAPFSDPADYVPDVPEYDSINGIKIDKIVQVSFLDFGEVEVSEEKLSVGLGKLSDLSEQVVCVKLALFSNNFAPLGHLYQDKLQILIAGWSALLVGVVVCGFFVLVCGLAHFEGPQRVRGAKS